MNKYLLTLREQRDTGENFEIEVESYNADDAIRQGNLLYERNTPKSIVIDVRPIAKLVDGVVIQQTALEAMSDELNKVINAGNKLAEAIHYIQKEYDGIHRARLALADWYKVRADEFGRDKSSLTV